LSRRHGIVTSRRALALLALLLMPAGCGRHRATRQEPPYQIGGAACLRALASRGIVVEPWAAPASGACRVDTPVLATGSATVSFSPPLQTSCAMLLAWADLEPAVQAAARARLGSPVLTVRNFGSYSCRGVNGHRGRLSLHALGRAVDVSGFGLADGRVVTVAEGWKGPRDQRRFLRDVRDAACRRLGAVLDPDSDRQHRDHLHLDLGPWRLCR
jgi:hypothetical protein